MAICQPYTQKMCVFVSGQSLCGQQFPCQLYKMPKRIFYLSMSYSSYLFPQALCHNNLKKKIKKRLRTKVLYLQCIIFPQPLVEVGSFEVVISLLENSAVNLLYLESRIGDTNMIGVVYPAVLAVLFQIIIIVIVIIVKCVERI